MRSTSTQTTWLLAAMLFVVAAIVLVAAGSAVIGLAFVGIAAMFAIFAFTMPKGTS